MLNLDLELIDIVNNPPSYDELKQIIELSDKNIDCLTRMEFYTEN